MKKTSNRSIRTFSLRALVAAGLLGSLSGLAIGPIAQAQTTVTETTTTHSTNIGGTVTEFLPGEAIVVRTESATEPMRYSVSKSVTYVDETGAPVSAEIVRSGLPVTVYYDKEGDRMVARKIVVKRKETKSGGKTEIREERRTTE